MKYGIKVALITTIFFGVLSCGQQDTDLDIYLLIGQSNMAGRAPITGEVADTLEGVYLFTNDSIRRWEPAANPLNKYSTIRKRIEMQKVGPGYAFAREMKKAYPEREIGLVVNAKGGTSILAWMPGTEFYDEAVSRTLDAMQDGQLKGILWLQGSSDSRRTDIYLDSLEKMVQHLRQDLGTPGTPFIAGELSEDKPHKIPFNEMLRGLPQRLDHSAVVSAEGTSTLDSTHFDTKSQVILGERYFEKMKEFLQE